MCPRETSGGWTMFSIEGRTRRLQYFFWEFGCSLILLVIAVAAAFACILADLPKDEAMGYVVPIVLIAAVPLTWLRVAAAFRRANDANVSRRWPQTYAGLSVALLALEGAEHLFGYDSSFGPGLGVIGIWAYLQCARSSDAVDPSEAAVFGDAPAYVPHGPGIGPATGLSALNSEDALRRRAAELSAPAKPVVAPPVRSGAAPRGGFGRRAQPAFGRR